MEIFLYPLKHVFLSSNLVYNQICLKLKSLLARTVGNAVIVSAKQHGHLCENVSVQTQVEKCAADLFILMNIFILLRCLSCVSFADRLYQQNVTTLTKIREDWLKEHVNACEVRLRRTRRV